MKDLPHFPAERVFPLGVQLKREIDTNADWHLCASIKSRDSVFFVCPEYFEVQNSKIQIECKIRSVKINARSAYAVRKKTVKSGFAIRAIDWVADSG